MHSLTCTLLLAFALLISSVVGQVVSPFATHDCSGQTVYTGDVQCNNNPTTCCAPTGACCAGGCCPETAVCVFAGTANEACCSLSDSTLCGSVQPQSTKTCPNPAGPSVPCSGADSSWYCAHGCTCNDSIDNGCNCFGGGSSDCSDSGSGASSSASTPTSTPTSTPESSSSEASTPVAVASSDAPSTTSMGSAQSTGAGGGASSTTASTAPAGTTTKASDGLLKVQASWAMGLAVVLFGVFMVL